MGFDAFFNGGCFKAYSILCFGVLSSVLGCILFQLGCTPIEYILNFSFSDFGLFLENLRLNLHSFIEQPAITKFGRLFTSTYRSLHSFATETDLACDTCCL